MTTARKVLEALADVEHHLSRLSAATRADEIVGAANAYLFGWSQDRIHSLQKIDGGWGPFDSRQRPELIRDVADIVRISNVLGKHRAALKDAGIEPVPEFLELELYFALARQVAESLLNFGRLSNMPTSRRTGLRQSSGGDALAA